MPKRSNEFQRLVTAIQSHISADAEVTESKMLRDLVSNELREVDVCIEGRVGGVPVVVSVECRDHRRKQSVGWVEEMHAKHTRLPTNVLVLASSSGFTGSAERKAASLNIETVTPGKLEPGEFGEHIVNKVHSLTAKRFDLTPRQCRFWVEETEDFAEEVVVAIESNIVYSSDGTEVCTATDIAEAVVRNLDLDNEAMRDSTGAETHFEIGIEDLASLSTPGAENGIYLQKLTDEGPVLRRVTKILVSGEIAVQVAELPLKHGELRGTGYAQGSAPGLGGTVELVATEAEDGTQRLSMNLTLD